MTGERDLAAILARLDVVREPGVFAVTMLPDGAAPPAAARAWIREREGVTVVLPLEDARAAGLEPVFEAARLSIAALRSLV